MNRPTQRLRLSTWISPETRTSLQQSTSGYRHAEGMMDVEDSCWRLLTMLWRLDIIKYEHVIDVDTFDDIRYQHQRDLIDMWYQIYTCRKLP